MAFDKSPETEALREQARAMGLKFHPSTGAKKLKTMMANHAESVMGSGPQTKSNQGDAPMSEAQVAEPVQQAPQKETKGQRIERLKREQLRLRRVIVHCNNDDKQELQGDIFTVGNDIVGTVRRFIPFDNEEGWHIEQILYDLLKQKRCKKWRNVKVASGETQKQSFMAPEYTITDLPPLTLEEIEKLKQRQRATGAVDA